MRAYRRVYDGRKLMIHKSSAPGPRGPTILPRGLYDLTPDVARRIWQIQMNSSTRSRGKKAALCRGQAHRPRSRPTSTITFPRQSSTVVVSSHPSCACTTMEKTAATTVDAPLRPPQRRIHPHHTRDHHHGGRRRPLRHLAHRGPRAGLAVASSGTTKSPAQSRLSPSPS